MATFMRMVSIVAIVTGMAFATSDLPNWLGVTLMFLGIALAIFQCRRSRSRSNVLKFRGPK